jgi:chromosome segregation ATPase
MGRADEAYVGGHGEGHYGDHFFADAPMDQAAAAKNAALLHSSDTFMPASVPGSYAPDAQGDHQYDSDSPCSQFGGQMLAYPQYLDSPNMLPVPAGAQTPSGQMLAPGGQAVTPACAMIGGGKAAAKKVRRAAAAKLSRDNAAARLRELEERNAQLEAEIADGKGEGPASMQLKNELGALKSELGALTFHADVLKTKNAQLEGTVSALQTQNAELLSTNGALRGENAGYAGGADAVLQIAAGAKAAAAVAEKEAKKRDARTKARERKVEQREEGAAAAQSAAEGTVFRLGEAVRLTAQLQRELGQAEQQISAMQAKIDSQQTRIASLLKRPSKGATESKMRDIRAECNAKIAAERQRAAEGFAHERGIVEAEISPCNDD